MFLLTTCMLLVTTSCSVLAATGAAADEHMRRDLGSIQASLGSVNMALASLDSSILDNPASPKVLLNSMNVLQVIQQATSSVGASQPLGLADTSNLKATTDSLVSNVNVTITDLINQKQVFDRLGLTKIVLIQVQNIQGAALSLASSLASKVDPAASNLAVDGISALSSALQRGVAVFNSRSSRSSSSTSAAPPAVASPAAAAPSNASSSAAPPAAPPQSNPAPSNPPPPNSCAGTIGPGPFAAMMPIPGTFVAGETCICMCPPVTPCPNS